ncbi:hypothetical protein ACLB1R_05025 [Escherichia coli]
MAADLYTAWTEAGAPAKENWAFTSLGILGNDDTARKLTPLIRAAPPGNPSINGRCPGWMY